MTAALAIFVKTPGLSPVKTRLAATLGAAQAAAFYARSAAATAAVVQRCEPALVPYWAVAEAGPQARRMWPDFAHLWQGEGQLGARLHRVYAELQQRYGSVLLIGADAPQLTPILLDEALAALDDNDFPFVIGDASDGGFWLVGGRQPIPQQVWLNVRYSQPDTGRRLREALSAFGAIANVPELGDVDTEADLTALVEALDALSNPLPAQRELLAWLHATLDHVVDSRASSRSADEFDTAKGR